MSEYIKVKDYPELVGKRARFKDNLPGYCASLWLKEGVIIQIEGVEHVGLSIKFDNPGKGMDLDSCYIQPDSFELLGDD